MTTVAIAAAGVAHAAPPSFSVSGAGATAPVPPGICAIEWTVNGAAGGAAGAEPGAPGGKLTVTLPAYEGDHYDLLPGAVGAAGDADGAGGLSASPFPGAGGHAGTSGSGGGGAASQVVRQTNGVVLNDLLVEAFGGRGAGPDGGAGGGDHDGVNVAPLADEGSFDPAGTGTGTAGSISGTGIPCAPDAPVLSAVTAGDGQLTVTFPGTQGRVPVDSFEYTIDGRTTWQPLTGVVTAMRSRTATITGLDNGTTYTVQVRALPTAGVPSGPSNAMTGTPFVTPGAPVDAAVITAPGELTVTWKPPAQAGEAVTGYVVHHRRGDAGGTICRADANASSCTAAVQSGLEYAVTVAALDTLGRPGPAVELPTGVIPFPATVPASDGALTATGARPASMAPGERITLSGWGYAPSSTVTVLVYSEPQILTTVVADGLGAFSVEVTLPHGLPAGGHTLVASGVDPYGTARSLTLPVTVTGGSASSMRLASTGADIAVPTIAGLAAVALGGALLLVARRRADA